MGCWMQSAAKLAPRGLSELAKVACTELPPRCRAGGSRRAWRATHGRAEGNTNSLPIGRAPLGTHFCHFDNTCTSSEPHSICQRRLNKKQSSSLQLEGCFLVPPAPGRWPCWLISCSSCCPRHSRCRRIAPHRTSSRSSARSRGACAATWLSTLAFHSHSRRSTNFASRHPSPLPPGTACTMRRSSSTTVCRDR